MGIQINGQNDEIRAVDGSGTVHLDVEGNITGNLVGNVTGQISGIQTSIQVGDTFLKPTSIGIGTTSTAGRNAGINTAIGTLIYNATIDSIQSYGPQGWKNVKSLVENGHTATGGLINDHQSGSTYYRSHIFTSSGTFDITQIGTFTESIEVLVCLLYTSPSPRDMRRSRMPSSA